MSLRVAVLGATGRTGRSVVAAVEAAPDLELAAAVHRGNLAPGVFDRADVVVDFSLPDALRAALPWLGGAALVSGTTGLSAADQAAVEARARVAPVLQAANFSPGVHVLLDLIARAAAALPDHDVEIVEAHHRGKRDAPSGTALALGRAVAEARGAELEAAARHGRSGLTGPRPTGEIGFHALRAGGIVGEHAVWLSSGAETVRLEHVAQSRDVFAEGSLRAARWLVGRPPGAYGMRQVLFGA